MAESQDSMMGESQGSFTTEPEATSLNGSIWRRPVDETDQLIAQEYSPWDNSVVLSLDGGGIKGYASLLILERLMLYVESEERRRSGTHYSDPDSEIERQQMQPMGSTSDIRPSNPTESGLVMDQEDESDGDEADTDEDLNDDVQSQGGESDADEDEINYDESTKPELPRRLRKIGELRHRPHEYFDYMFGTSTGGLIALLLGRLQMQAKDAREIYERLCGDIFGTTQWFSTLHLRTKYDPAKLEQAVRAVVDQVISERNREETTGQYSELPLASDPSMCRTVCVAYRFDRSKNRNKIIRRPYLFRSYERLPGVQFRGLAFNHSTNEYSLRTGEWAEACRAHGKKIQASPAYSGPIWAAARATSAAPPYFPSLQIDNEIFLDGGFGFNNPATVAHYEVMLMHNSRRSCIKLLLSIGTGIKDENPRITSSSLAGLWQAIKHSLGYLTNSNETHTVMQTLDNQHAAKYGRRFYTRLDPPPQVGNLELDTWLTKSGTGNPTTRDKIQCVVGQWLSEEKQKKKLRKIAKTLVDVRIRRRDVPQTLNGAPSTRDAMCYRCTVDSCRSGQIIRESVQALRAHILQDHPEFNDPNALRELNKMIDRGCMRPPSESGAH